MTAVPQVSALFGATRRSTSRTKRGSWLTWAGPHRDCAEQVKRLSSTFIVVGRCAVAVVPLVCLPILARARSNSAGATGPEPAASSASTRLSPGWGLRRWLYPLLTMLVLVGVWECLRRLFARSSPRFLPTGRRHIEPRSRRRPSVGSTMAGVAAAAAPEAKQGRLCPARAVNRGRSRSPPQRTARVS
jgi:hypothetical protein